MLNQWRKDNIAERVAYRATVRCPERNGAEFCGCECYACTPYCGCEAYPRLCEHWAKARARERYNKEVAKALWSWVG